MFLSTLFLGLVLGGTYALLALGLSLQYGIARIMNLAYGEFMLLACFAVTMMFTSWGLGPLWGLLVVVPLGYALGWIIHAVMMRPLINRSGGGGRLEVDTILATFGLLFVVQGLMLITFGSDFTSYSYLDQGVGILGTTIAANRLIAFAVSLIIGFGLYALMIRTRWGRALRAVALAPASAYLVGIDVNKLGRQGFALGGALAAAGGALISMFQTFSATDGVVFTMKALIVVIMGGVGNILGALIAGLLLGLAETFVAAFIDPGLTLAATYTLFLAVLLWRPTGLFGKAGG
ncbi:branched-chain amino acid ABC transporter permease [Salipiger sp. PrR002]|uniref:branched-chain amino acid ABC transporter permease n=1 Tax=Salipiger sp. PrR002 TaxID=2706489 RepID=UPI0013BDDAD0|nr:branched-chain amino acid ABC transporter permease [Salipiger sp. PrR002]NDV99470.1 branched-chain amino acid ABC transporter permease [Salipiger sp. PrR002]NDW58654.1 branched-chain amino acid ABC transporter permease [Salipiger sp. PrR004]